MIPNLIPSSPLCGLRAVAAAALLSGSLPVIAQTPPPAAPATPDGPVIVSPDPVRPPPKHREVRPSPAKPKEWPTKPQPLIRQLR